MSAMNDYSCLDISKSADKKIDVVSRLETTAVKKNQIGLRGPMVHEVARD